MPKQTVPDISFGKLTIKEISVNMKEKKIHINREYQRGDVWKQKQKIELIKSIDKRYSIGVLVLFINDNGQFEILDGQQRILTINQYVDDNLDLSKSEVTPYSKLNLHEKTLLDAYCVFYLKLKSHDPESKEEDILQTFLRLQEGTPLNKAEKINAYRGAFKDTFREIRDSHSLFSYLGVEKRFRFRQLAAELLLLELESDFSKKRFPDLDLATFILVIKKYEKEISKTKLTHYKGNLDCLHQSLNTMLSALKISDILMLYLLISYLRKIKANNSDLMNQFADFTKQFMSDLNSFSMYDEAPPVGMSMDLFQKLKEYKLQAKMMTPSSSIERRFEILLGEYERRHPFIIKDPNRLHDIEQKRILYFRQGGVCPECNNSLDFRSKLEAHHVIKHSEGGKTNDLANSVLLHEKCHRRIEKREKNS